MNVYTVDSYFTSDSLTNRENFIWLKMIKNELFKIQVNEKIVFFLV